MPVFKYNGDKKEMKGVFGYDFSDFKEVEVAEDDGLAIRKLTSNSHFDLVSEDIDDPNVNFDYGVFRVKEDGKNYSKPDKVFEKKEDAQAFIDGFDDGKKRTILKREQA